MKTFFFLSALLFSTHASAEVIRRDCKFADYQTMTDAVSHEEIRSGKQLRNEVLGVLREEMGPQCFSVLDTSMLVSIPGDDASDYELVTGSSTYHIRIVKSFEQRATFVYLTKKKNK